VGWLWLASQRDQITQEHRDAVFNSKSSALALITALVPLMPRIKQRDKDLADQHAPRRE
jgi:hypothetical protein